MEKEYRIKEVKVPLKIGEITVYYPQVKGDKIETKGHLWWKKVTTKEFWYLFTKIGEEIYVEYDESKDGIYSDTKENAILLIEEFKKQSTKRTKSYWSKQASNWEDEKYVKYHKA
ncbi:MAG: hypothetical protein IPJ01_10800 [Micavibrio sp.]|nr:hypothetical protein [Micavibrio sp.]